MPLALLEAQALGVPAVAFDCPTGPREILSEAHRHRSFRRGRAGAWRRRCCACSAIRRCGRAMGAAAIARDREVFSRARQVGAWAALIDEVATTAGAAGPDIR